MSNPALHAAEFCLFNNAIYLVLKLPEGDDLFGSSHGAVINDGRLLSAATLHVTVHSIVAHVQLPTNEPDREQHARLTTFKDQLWTTCIGYFVYNTSVHTVRF